MPARCSKKPPVQLLIVAAVGLEGDADALDVRSTFARSPELAAGMRERAEKQRAVAAWLMEISTEQPTAC